MGYSSGGWFFIIWIGGKGEAQRHIFHMYPVDHPYTSCGRVSMGCTQTHACRYTTPSRLRKMHFLCLGRNVLSRMFYFLFCYKQLFVESQRDSCFALELVDQTIPVPPSPPRVKKNARIWWYFFCFVVPKNTTPSPLTTPATPTNTLSKNRIDMAVTSITGHYTTACIFPSLPQRYRYRPGDHHIHRHSIVSPSLLIPIYEQTPSFRSSAKHESLWDSTTQKKVFSRREGSSRGKNNFFRVWVGVVSWGKIKKLMCIVLSPPPFFANPTTFFSCSRSGVCQLRKK